MGCLFGHKWDGCKCSKCEKTRNEQHEYDLCKGKCKRCDATQTEQHDWNGCKCSRCGKARDEQHDWDECNVKCSRCGKAGEARHDWSGRKCSKCGAAKRCEHEWKGETCTHCGENREFGQHTCKFIIHKLDNKSLNEWKENERNLALNPPSICCEICSRNGFECLTGIFPRWEQFDSNAIERFKSANMDKVRAIGEALNKSGGMKLMRLVGEKFAKDFPQHGRLLETMWNGIGNWRV